MRDFKYFYYPASVSESIKGMKTKKATCWENLGEKNILRLTNYVIDNVPAYLNFIKDNNFQRRNINSIEDFNDLPLMDKDSYLKKYNYLDLFPKDFKDKITTVSSTSGSTGEPFYFPRGEEQDAQYQYLAEVYCKNQFDIDNKTTLAINGFGLGIWIGGIFTYKIFNKLAQKGYKIAVAPIGTSKEIFLKTFKKTADLFDQIILMGYPPFLKDVVDEGKDYGINWKKHDLKVMTATEGFSEEFRMYLVRTLGLKNRYSDILNIYGSVEFGTMSHETAISNLIRKISLDKDKVFKTLFPKASFVPTVAQFYPHIVYFEEINDEVVASGFGSSFPLIRYRFHDAGGVITFDEMVSKLKSLDIDIYKEAEKVGIEKTILKLPFVYVYARNDFVVIIRGANIYPQNIRMALENPKLEKYVTGKFCMQRRENKKLDEYLEVNVELKKGVKKIGKIQRLISNVILKTLRENNSEFNYLYTHEGSKLTPDVIPHLYEDPKYFAPSIKQKWVK